jgi:predicted ATPase
VPLLDLADPRLIPDKVLEVLRLPRLPGTGPLEQIAAFLGRQPSLLVLDNCEHLVDGGAEIVRTLLERVESLTVLATSRRLLGLEGEREFPVAPLPTPVESRPLRVQQRPVRPISQLSTLNSQLSTLAACPSVQLFVDRAQAVRPDFQLTRANAAAVAALCARLEGLPLTIELAAARIGVLTPQQMLARLEQRFELLTRRKRAADPRHCSLQSTLDWSYQLLPPELQQFFARLSVFHGGFSLEAAEAVCGEKGVRKDRSPGPTPDTQYLTPALAFLEQLRECSLLIAEQALPSGERPMPVTDGGPFPAGCPAEMRYRFLESVREYAHNRLSEAGELERLRGRHLQFFRELAERAEPELAGPDQAVWLERMEVELDNVRAALAGAVESGSAEEGLRLAGALWAFWSVRCHWAEGREWLARLLRQPAPDVHPVVRARGQACAGVLAWVQSDRREARALLNESLAVGRESRHRWLTAFSLRNLGMAALGEGDLEAAQSLLEEGLVIWRELGHPWGIRISLQNLAGIAMSRGDTTEARALCEASLAVSRELGGQWITGWSLICLGEIATAEADLPRARAHFQEGLEIHRSLGHRAGVAHLLNRLGRVSVLQGDTAAGYSCWRESLTLCHETGDLKGFVETLEVVAHSVAAQRQFERAARLFGATERLRETMGHPLSSGEQAGSAHCPEEIRAGLGAEAFAAAWEKGRALLPEQAVAEALEEA